MSKRRPPPERCRCSRPDLVFDNGKWKCRDCSHQRAIPAPTAVHFPPVVGYTSVRQAKVKAPPSTLCDEWKPYRTTVAGTVTCVRCIAILHRRPQLFNVLMAADKGAAAE